MKYVELRKNIQQKKKIKIKQIYKKYLLKMKMNLYFKNQQNKTYFYLKEQMNGNKYKKNMDLMTKQQKINKRQTKSIKRIIIQNYHSLKKI